MIMNADVEANPGGSNRGEGIFSKILPEIGTVRQLCLNELRLVAPCGKGIPLPGRGLWDYGNSVHQPDISILAA